MNMTFEQYIANPMGKNNAVMSGMVREAIRTSYTNKFNQILLRENGKIDYFLYKDEKKNCYYILIKIPSEVIKNFYYDVVIKFFTDEKVKEGGSNLEKYNIQFFSNDPAFVFTYAHTFLKNGLFIKELSARMSKNAIQNKAKEKNPQNLNGYVKSIYFAYLFMKQKGLFKKVQFDAAEPFIINNLLFKIEDADDKIKKRQDEEAKRDKRKKINVDKNTMRNINKIGISSIDSDRLVTMTKSTKSIGRIGGINTSKNKFIKTTKKK